MLQSVIVRQIAPCRDTPETEQDIANLVNSVYAVAEAGIWVPNNLRVTDTEIKQLINEGCIFGAYLDDQLIGCIRLEIHNVTTTEFGMLAVDPGQRSMGVGRKLVELVEQWNRKKGVLNLECGVLNPVNWKLQSKDDLMEWYMRIGFRKIGTRRFEDVYLTMKGNLVTECEYTTFTKDLRQ